MQKLIHRKFNPDKVRVGKMTKNDKWWASLIRYRTVVALIYCYFASKSIIWNTGLIWFTTPIDIAAMCIFIFKFFLIYRCWILLVVFLTLNQRTLISPEKSNLRVKNGDPLPKEMETRNKKMVASPHSRGQKAFFGMPDLPHY